MVSSSLVTLDDKPFLFDRRRTDHPWLDALNRLDKSDVPGLAPLAKNWRMDSRVNTTREQRIEKDFPLGSAPTFDAAVHDYFKQFQCRSSAIAPFAAYVGAENAGNLIPVDDRPSRNHHLLHLASVNRLLKFIYIGSNPNLADFQMKLRRLTGQRSPSNMSDAEVEKLVDVLQAKGAEAVKNFARLVSDALGSSEPLWWAASAHEIGELPDGADWTDAVRKTGQGHLERGEWLMAWRYSPELAGRLYRPTVAEAGKNGFHFPSPPMAVYGITMPLMKGMPAVRELVHAPLKGGVSEETCTGGFGKIQRDPIEIKGVKAMLPWFEQRRHTHGDYLVRHQPPYISAAGWLQRHGVGA